jgi:hypothetical protein
LKNPWIYLQYTSIGIIGPLSHFDYTNFKVSLIIKIINFNENIKMAHLAMLVIFHVNVIICQIFNLPHIYCIFVEKTHFLLIIFFKLVTWYTNMVLIMWNDMVQYTFNFHKNKKSFKYFLKYIFFFEYTSTLHLFPQIYSNISLHKMKWNSFFFNILPRLYSNIIWKDIMKLFQKFDVGYIQACTPLESSTMWHLKGHHSVLSPIIIIMYGHMEDPIEWWVAIK